MENNVNDSQTNQPNRRPANDNVPSQGGFLAGQGGFEGLTPEHLQAANEHKVLFLSGKTKVKLPKD